MHGVIFRSLREYVRAARGDEAADTVFGARGNFEVDQACPDERLAHLIERAALASGREVDAVVHDFGVFTAITTFPRLYPAFFSVAASAREFLLTVEGRIHELVRAMIPNAVPPELAITPLDDDGVSLIYASRRGSASSSVGSCRGPRATLGSRPRSPR